MTRLQKTLWIGLGAVAVIALVTTTLIAAPLATGLLDPGIASVRVHEKSEGFRLFVPVPAVMLHLGLGGAARAGAFDHVPPLPPEAHTVLGVARGMMEEIIEGPDVTLVEVESRNEHVSVAKRGRRLVVTVRSPDVDVDVSVPGRLALRALDLVEASARQAPGPNRLEEPLTIALPDPTL